MASVDVLRTLMVLRARRGRGLLQPELGEERAEVDSLLGRLGGRDDFGLARREGHAGLFL
eukprot:3494134-Pleurochrysis_carterae.AAC.1